VRTPLPVGLDVLAHEGQLPSQLLVETVDDVPRLLHTQTRHETLNPEMVFLVDHHAHGLPSREMDGGAVGRLLSLLAEEVPGHQSALVEDASGPISDLGHLQKGPVLEDVGTIHGALEVTQDGLPVVHPRPRPEGVTLEVAGQPDAGGQDDVGVLAARLQPAEAVIRDRVEVVHRAESLMSRAQAGSRSRI